MTLDHARDPLGLRDDAPLLDAWLTATEHAREGRLRPFIVPGHKQRTDLIGPLTADDPPMFGGMDTLKLSHGLLLAAEAKAARLWGADWCRFGVNGSSQGNQALMLGIAEPGREIIVTRTLHRSLLLGIILAGMRPVWVRPDVDHATGLPTAVPVSAVTDALDAHPDAGAVFLGDPSYVGGTGDLAGHAAAAHAAGVPLLVDAAWAAHFGFHPAVPDHALACGADAMVFSAHKALPARTQAAVVMARTTRTGGLLDADRLERGFDATHTTSPSGPILASIDAARALMARHGERLVGRMIALVGQARADLRRVEGLDVLAGPAVDPAKLVILLAGTGAHGHLVEEDLIAAGFALEMADRDVLVAMVTVADDEDSVAALVEAVSRSVERHRGTPRRPVVGAAWSVDPEQVLSPREAFFARHETVPVDRAIGRVSAELAAPYPPGVPVLAPGERIDADLVTVLRETRDDGGRIAYAADPTLATFQVVADR